MYKVRVRMYDAAVRTICRALGRVNARQFLYFVVGLRFRSKKRFMIPTVAVAVAIIVQFLNLQPQLGCS